MADLPIGAAIRHVRKLRGMSQNQLAEKLDIGRCYVSKIENGHATPGIILLFRFAEAMEAKPYKLVKLISEMDVPDRQTSLE